MDTKVPLPRDEISMVLLRFQESAVNREDVVGPVIIVEVNDEHLCCRADKEASVSNEKGPSETLSVAPV